MLQETRDQWERGGVLLCGVLLYAMKAVVSMEGRASGEAPLLLLPWLPLAVGWPGMRLNPFRSLGRLPKENWKLFLRMGAARILLGAAFLLLARGLGLPPGCHRTQPGPALCHGAGLCPT